MKEILGGAALLFVFGIGGLLYGIYHRPVDPVQTLALAGGLFATGIGLLIFIFFISFFIHICLEENKKEKERLSKKRNQAGY